MKYKLFFVLLMAYCPFFLTTLLSQTTLSKRSSKLTYSELQGEYRSSTMVEGLFKMFTSIKLTKQGEFSIKSFVEGDLVDEFSGSNFAIEVKKSEKKNDYGESLGITYTHYIVLNDNVGKLFFIITDSMNKLIPADSRSEFIYNNSFVKQ